MSESGNPRKSWRRVPASFVVTNLDGGATCQTAKVAGPLSAPPSLRISVDLAPERFLFRVEVMS